MVVSFPEASSTSLTTTLAPATASAVALARPKPDPAPVTIATLPSNVALTPPDRSCCNRAPSCVLGGVSTAWEADVPVLRELYPALRRFAGVVAAAGVPPDDLVQEAMMRVLARGGLEGIDDPLAYMRRTIMNLASNERRRAAIGRRALTRHGADAAAAARAHYPSDLDELRRLPARDRALLYLTEVEGEPIAEAAALTGCSEGAARMALSRARRALRKLLEDDDAITS